MKNYAFIDSQNLNIAIQDLGWKLDFKKFRVFLRDKYKVKKAFLFVGYVSDNEKMYTALKNAGYIVIFKPTLDKKGIIKGNCDAELVLNCMIEYKNFDKAIIISGDGDFHCLIEYLEAKKKLLKIGIPNKRQYSSLLRKFTKFFFYIGDYRSKLQLGRPKAKSKKSPKKSFRHKPPRSHKTQPSSEKRMPTPDLPTGKAGADKTKKKVTKVKNLAAYPPHKALEGVAGRQGSLKKTKKKGEHSFRHRHLR